MTPLALATAAVAAMALAPACSDASGEAPGKVVVWLSVGRGQGVGVVSGEVRVASADSDERVPFALDGDRTEVVYPNHRAELVLERRCDPAAGPVTVTLTLSDFTPDTWPSAGLPIPLHQTEAQTLPCRPGWTEVAELAPVVEDARRYGTITARVVLEAPPEGATEAVVLFSASTWSSPLPLELLTLSREGDALVGETALVCETRWPDLRLEQSVVSLEIPGLSQDEVWARWPPPPPSEITQRCVPGETATVELRLAPRDL